MKVKVKVGRGGVQMQWNQRHRNCVTRPRSRRVAGQKLSELALLLESIIDRMRDVREEAESLG